MSDVRTMRAKNMSRAAWWNRLLTAIESMSAGKPGHWKHMKKQ